MANSPCANAWRSFTPNGNVRFLAGIDVYLAVLGLDVVEHATQLANPSLCWTAPFFLGERGVCLHSRVRTCIFPRPLPEIHQIARTDGLLGFTSLGAQIDSADVFPDDVECEVLFV